VLAHTGCSQENPFGFPDLTFRLATLIQAPGELLAHARLQHGAVQLFLAKQGQFAAVLEAEEVRQPVRADAFRACRLEKYPVGVREPGGIVSQDGSGQYIPSSAV